MPPNPSWHELASSLHHVYAEPLPVMFRGLGRLHSPLQVMLAYQEKNNEDCKAL